MPGRYGSVGLPKFFNWKRPAGCDYNHYYKNVGSQPKQWRELENQNMSCKTP